MSEIQVIDIKEKILSTNDHLADDIRLKLQQHDVYMVNLMASPGAGKTSVILNTIRCLKQQYSITIIEGDIESTVDAEKVAAEGIDSVQLRTGGACHLDAAMIDQALQTLNLDDLDLIIIENVGNLVCPAEFDTGANIRAMILSVPEGDDKVLKYPLMFSVCDALIVNKIDCNSNFDFDLESLKSQLDKINPDIKVFEMSCKTGEGVSNWCQWLAQRINHKS